MSPGAVLVVDDQKTNRMLLRRTLEQEGYRVTEAGTGAAALDLLETRRFDLVLLDVVMPGLDGVEVLKRIRARQSVAALPVIMVTARDDTGDMVQALSAGANDYVTKPLDLPVVMARVHTQMSLHRANEALAEANDRMERDLSAAARIQQALLPREAPSTPGLSFAWSVMPCEQLAGDTLNILELDDRLLALYLIDVSGHGVPAALLSVTLSHMLAGAGDSTVLYRRSDETAPLAPRAPAEVARKLNRLFPLDVENGQYFTLAYGLLDAASGALHFVCAGHPAPILLRAGGTAEAVGTPDIAIGWSEEPEYHDQRLIIERGDRILLYSDGLIEARDARGEPFGLPRLLAAFEAHRGRSLRDVVDRLSAQVRCWCDGKPVDDVSLLACERLEPA